MFRYKQFLINTYRQTTDRWPEVVKQADKWQTDRQTGGQEDRRCYMMSKITGDALYKPHFLKPHFLIFKKVFKSFFILMNFDDLNDQHLLCL
jgi:hypothetical protein